ncbi:MAG: formylglycine-generating enzyme family protein, partial [Planctomycetes bacterium]|nr:formylglycine-generating enzyme family protein [Planctomycetota bacterium]
AVTLYLLNSVNLMIRPKLFADLRPGTRIVSHAFTMDDWKADRVIQHPRARGGSLYFWVIPAKVGGIWRWSLPAAGGGIEATAWLDQEFQNLSGTVAIGGDRSVEIADAAIDGREVSFSAPASIGGREVRVSYRGTVEGDVIDGTSEWGEGPAAGKAPWVARRQPVPIAGTWAIHVPQRVKTDGALRIRVADNALHATYAVAREKKDVEISALYVWGASIRFEATIAGQSLTFRGRFDGTSGGGTVKNEGASAALVWSAKYIQESPAEPNESEPRATSRLPSIGGRAALALLAGGTGAGEEPARRGSSGKEVRRWIPSMGAPQAGDEFLNEKDGSVLVWIPGGEFIMGSETGSEDERPAHRVRVEGFWLGRYEVTNEQYAAFLKAHAGKTTPQYWEDPEYTAPDQPVVGVTHSDAVSYCEWAGLRLPTEAEWEYAAGGGKRLAYPTSTGEIGNDLANIRGTGGGDTWLVPSPVGRFPPNPFGIHDMAGNAWEWTSTRFEKYPYSADDGREDGERYGLRVLRGGCWYFPADYCRTAHRHRFASHLRYDYAGIRVARGRVPGAGGGKEEE